MLSCKQVAHVASDYLDNNTPLKWQIRLHLLMCANCRRFVKHLAITQKMAASLDTNNSSATTADADEVWRKVKAKINNSADN